MKTMRTIGLAMVILGITAADSPNLIWPVMLLGAGAALIIVAERHLPETERWNFYGKENKQ